MHFSSALALAFAATASAQNYLGFNSGATKDDRSAKFKSDFVAEFKTAQNLKGAPGKFNAVRLYTNIQAYSDSDPIQAFEAAIETKTSILLGVWASGVDNIDKELSALKKAVDSYGSKFTDLVIGISIGSEDLYRVSATGIKNKSGVGNSPDAIVGFINDYRDAFKNTGLSDVPVGHVDTWDVWPNTTNSKVIDAVDWLGVDEYPYYEGGKGNHIDNAEALFDKAYDATLAASKGKPVWVTETGWPSTGPDWDEAVASVKNAKSYWDNIGCKKLFNKTPTFWYTLRDSNPENEMKFAVTKDLSTTPIWDLSCPEEDDSTSTSSGTSKPTGTSSKGNGPSSTGSSTGGDSSASATETGSSGATETGSAGASETGTDGTTATTGGAGAGAGTTGTTTGATTSQTSSIPQGAASTHMVSAAAYGGLALVAAFFALI